MPYESELGSLTGRMVTLEHGLARLERMDSHLERVGPYVVPAQRFRWVRVACTACCSMANGGQLMTSHSAMG